MKGILFKPEVWQAKLRVLDQYGEAQTRRLDGLKAINQEPTAWYLVASFDDNTLFRFGSDKYDKDILIKPRYQVGETVYVKEAYWQDQSGGVWGYKLDGIEWPPANCGGKAISPPFMPEWAARYFIKITGVRAERVQDISASDSDMIAEGISLLKYINNRTAWGEMAYEFEKRWNSINPKYPWESNPWVFPYTFERNVPERMADCSKETN